MPRCPLTPSLAVGQSTAPTPSRGWTSLLRRRWPLLVGLALGVLALLDNGLDGSRVTAQLAVVALVMAAAYLPIGAARRQLSSARVLLVEVLGVLAFAALALGALLADGQLAQYLLATAWLGHGDWDVAHHRADRVVPRWYAVICAILDVAVGLGILLAAPHL